MVHALSFRKQKTDCKINQTRLFSTARHWIICS